jgi:hypothetical protein
MKYKYLGYAYSDMAGWTDIVKNLLYTLDKVTRPWWFPLWLVNSLYYLSTGNSVVLIRSWFWYNFFENVIRKYILKEYVSITDIKEKWGTLRIYYSGSKLPSDLIDSAIEDSYNVCYNCGKHDNCEIIAVKGWDTNLCKQCKNDLKKK